MRTYRGGCHCGAVRFEADLGSRRHGHYCSICTKMRLWSVQAGPQAFRLLAGAAELANFRGGNSVAHHPFCRRCGIHAFDRVEMPNMSGAPHFNVNVACLDDLDVDELMAAPVAYFDGRNDNWGSTPAEVRHL